MEKLAQVPAHLPRLLLVLFNIIIAVTIIATTCTFLSYSSCTSSHGCRVRYPNPVAGDSISTYQTGPQDSDNKVPHNAGNKMHKDSGNKSQGDSKDSGRLKQRLPKCLVIGVRKGGTRAVLTFLDLHPDIVTVYQEQQFFNNDRTYSKGLTHYKKQMPLSYPHQLTIEKTPEYFTQYVASQRVYQMNSSIRLLLTVRNPVVRVVSDYAMKKDNANKADIRYPALKDIVLDESGNVNDSERSVNISTYHVHFARWLTFFPRSQIHIIDGDNLVRKPYIEMAKIERFLGIKPFLTKNKFFFNETKGFHCIKTDHGPECLVETKGRKHPDIQPKLLTKLIEYFKPKNEIFFSLAGKRFDWK